MSKPSILKTPEEHFTEATELAVLATAMHLRASELAIIDPIASVALKEMAKSGIQLAVSEIAKGAEAAGLSTKIGLPYLGSLDPRLREMLQKYMPSHLTHPPSR